jgi:hypothetical protein
MIIQPLPRLDKRCGLFTVEIAEGAEKLAFLSVLGDLCGKKSLILMACVLHVDDHQI